VGALIETSDDRVEARIAFDAPPEVRDFVEDPARVTGFFGPFGCAKTTAGAMKCWLYGQAWPGARILCSRSTWPALEDTTQKTFFEWFPDGVAGQYHKTKRVYDLFVGEDLEPVHILFRGLEDNDDIQRVLSLDLAAAWLDEPQGGVSIRRDGTIIREAGIARDLALAILARCGRQRGYPKMLWLTGNPPPPSQWITREFEYVPGPTGHDAPTNLRPGWHLYLGTQDTNRHNLPSRYYEDLEQDYGAETPMARRFLRGEWIEWAAMNPFVADRITYWGDNAEDRPALADLVIEAGIDPAISEKDQANYSALVVAGQVRRGINRGRIYVLLAVKGHWSLREQVDRLLKAVVEWKVRTVRVEDVAYQKALGEELDHEARQRNIVVRVELVKPDGDKLRRANSWAPLVEHGTVVLGPGQKALVDAMLAVPMDRSQWDLVDAAGLCIRGFPRLQGESMPVPGQERDLPARARSYAVRASSTPKPPRAAEMRWTGPAPGRPELARRELQRAVGYAVRPRSSPRKVAR